MFNWIRKSAGDPLAVSMSGIKLGDRLLVVGCADPKLIAALGAKVGLTGQACAVDEDEALAAEAARVAEAEGVLIETAVSRGTELPYPNDSFDVVVVRAMSPSEKFSASATLIEVRRLLRPGGRCVAIEGHIRAGVSALFGGGGRTAPAPAEIVAAFAAAGFLAVRTLAERDGLVFVEGVKKNL